MNGVHPMWLPDRVTAPLAGRTVTIVGDDPLLATVRREAARAGLTEVTAGADLVFAPESSAVELLGSDPARRAVGDGLGAEGFALVRIGDRRAVVYGGGAGALYGWFALVREAARPADPRPDVHRSVPAHPLRMLDHWDNVAVHPTMGQVERGYSGGSIFYSDGEVRADLRRVGDYGRLLAAVGVNRVAINNVNVHRRETLLLTDDLDEVARIAEQLRPWGIRTHLSVNFAAPMIVGALDTADPLDPDVIAWWAAVADKVYSVIPDFGGFLVKADSEGQPGPFAYGRTHAEGANVLARALAPHGGTVHWRAFVYNHRQDWRDRKTDRARAAYDHFAPLDGQFDGNVVVQVKHGPMDFQVREPISPVIAAMPHTRIAVEFQVTQEYTGQQKHAVYLGPEWHEILAFRPRGAAGPTVADLTTGGFAAVSNVGDDPFWTGHPLAQANLYAFGRLMWEPTADPLDVLDEWISLTFGPDPVVRDGIHAILDGSWATYEDYTAPLGVGFMVNPHFHYGPAVDGYEYSPWGTYHFADRDGIGVDRSLATGTGYAGQYPEPWRSRYESTDSTPDELLLFFHHVPYTHRLHRGDTVVQHIYDTHFAGVEAVERAAQAWHDLAGRVDDDVHARGRERFAEQLRSAVEWRDQINTYFFRSSGIPDEHGRVIH